MLPRSTNTRNDRESVKGRIGGRTHEISRLIGRSLRAVVDMKGLGENTIQIDCDVLQADGGTRTAAITGAYVALADAIEWARDQKFIGQRAKPLIDTVSAVSVGIIDGVPMLDLAYVEDVRAETDMNVVATGRGLFVEVQGTAEGAPFDRRELDSLLDLALAGTAELTLMQQAALAEAIRGGRRVSLEFVLASHNAHKVREFQRIIGERMPQAVVLPYDGPEPVEEGVTFAENALIKARAAAEHTGRIALADDSGLVVDVMGGAAPGIFSARWAGSDAGDEANVRLLLDQLSDIRRPDRGAEFRCTIALVVPDSVLPGGHEFVAEGRWRGTLAYEPRGSHGFGYDPIFEPEGLEVTSAELQPGGEERAEPSGARVRGAPARARASRRPPGG